MRGSSFIDTNVFLRYFTADLPEESQRVKILLSELEAGSVEAETSDLVFAELVWVMESHYNLPRDEIAQKLSFLVNLRGLKLINKSLILEALASYATSNVDFVDTYNAAFMRHRSIETIYSYDKDFDRLNLKRIVP